MYCNKDKCLYWKRHVKQAVMGLKLMKDKFHFKIRKTDSKDNQNDSGGKKLV